MLRLTLTLTVACLLCVTSCESADDEVNDPKTTVYSCHWVDRKVCEEYLPVQVDSDSSIFAIVIVKEARETCTRVPWNANVYGNGIFTATPCDQTNTLGRCVMTPSYQARRYYEVGFSDVPSSADPGNDTIGLACGWLTDDAYYERPPYAD